MEGRDAIKLLVERAQAGDLESFTELNRLFRHRVASLVRGRLGERLKSAVEAEDIVQETFLRAFQSIRDFRWQGAESFFRWLAGISQHVIQEQAKRHRFRQAGPLDSDVAGDGLSQSKARRREERFDRLEKALKTLSPDHRQVILLARVERLPLNEVAERMGRTRGAVRQLLWRALQELKNVFGETESLHLPPRSLQPEGGTDERG
jgi:RNA polymerase sigma-70 factor (ECF subfamily)